MTITLSDEEKRFIQACYNDSFNEGHFDALFDGLDTEAIQKSLADKGLLEKERWD